MDTGFDHVTIAVTDLVEAERFFALLGFAESKRVVVSGDEMSAYMGISDWKADHVTLRHTGAVTHQEVQLLQFHNPPIDVDPGSGNLGRTGFSHVCFRVGDLDSVLQVLSSNGITARSDLMEFHDRRLIFLDGPSGVVVELAEWKVDPGG
jgi:catechol 2,3-dioxygenase-like lactoylglutathione lyase family enzyme